MKYIDEFIRMKCASDLLSLDLFPNGKEITESMGAYNAVREHIRWAFDDTAITCYCVGDGQTPRTAALFAYRTKWDVVSIDPNLRNKGKWTRIKRLSVYPRKVEKIVHKKGGKVVIVAVHNHANLHTAVKNLHGNITAVVAIPCCFAQTIPNIEQDVDYVDENICSEKNRVLVWQGIPDS